MKRRLKTGIVLLLVVMMTIPAFGMSVETVGNEGSGQEYASDRIIVKFAENATAAEKRSIKASYNLETKRKLNMGAEAMLVKGNRSVEALITVLNRMDKVEYAELDHILRIPEHEVDALPNDPYDHPDWYLWGMDNINAPGAWALEQGRPEVIVAVIDTGIDYNHIELDGNMWINEAEYNGQQGINEDSNGYESYQYIDDIYGWDYVNDDADPFDDNSHGTHVSGTIAAEANDLGVVGVAPNVKVMALKCFDADGYGDAVGFSSDIAAAIEYADEKGASIINASWGGYNYSTTIKSAIDNFEGVFAAAAGNDSIDTNPLGNPHYPSSYDCSNIISVASIDEGNNMSDFSNYGTESVDLFAPGGSIWSVHPGDYSGDDPIYYLSGKSGTSMATPHVSGVLALMISHEMDVNELTSVTEIQRTPSMLIDHVMESAVYDVDYAQYVKSSGRLNAYEALLLTPEYGTEPPAGNQPPVNTAIPKIVPAIDGTVEAGTELTADLGTWTDDESQTISYECRWLIESGTGFVEVFPDSTGIYIPEGADVGKKLKIEVTATDNGTPEESAVEESALYEIIPASDAIYPTITPSEGDTPPGVRIGNELTANPGNWAGDEASEYDITWLVKVNRNRTVSVGKGTSIILDGYEGKIIKLMVTAISTGKTEYSVEYEILPATTEPDPEQEPDPIPDSLAVVLTTPEDGSRNIVLSPTIKITFNKDITLLDGSLITLSDDGVKVDLNADAIKVSEQEKNVLEIPVSDLDYKTTYVLTIPTGVVTDSNDVTMTEDFTMKFKTIIR